MFGGEGENCENDLAVREDEPQRPEGGIYGIQVEQGEPTHQNVAVVRVDEEKDNNRSAVVKAPRQDADDSDVRTTFNAVEQQQLEPNGFEASLSNISAATPSQLWGQKPSQPPTPLYSRSSEAVAGQSTMPMEIYYKPEIIRKPRQLSIMRGFQKPQLAQIRKEAVDRIASMTTKARQAADKMGFSVSLANAELDRPTASPAYRPFQFDSILGTQLRFGASNANMNNAEQQQQQEHEQRVRAQQYETLQRLLAANGVSQLRSPLTTTTSGLLAVQINELAAQRLSRQMASPAFRTLPVGSIIRTQSQIIQLKNGAITASINVAQQQTQWRQHQLGQGVQLPQQLNWIMNNNNNNIYNCNKINNNNDNNNKMYIPSNDYNGKETNNATEQERGVAMVSSNMLAGMLEMLEMLGPQPLHEMFFENVFQNNLNSYDNDNNSNSINNNNNGCVNNETIIIDSISMTSNESINDSNNNDNGQMSNNNIENENASESSNIYHENINNNIIYYENINNNNTIYYYENNIMKSNDEISNNNNSSIDNNNINYWNTNIYENANDNNNNNNNSNIDTHPYANWNYFQLLQQSSCLNVSMMSHDEQQQQEPSHVLTTAQYGVAMMVWKQPNGNILNDGRNLHKVSKKNKRINKKKKKYKKKMKRFVVANGMAVATTEHAGMPMDTLAPGNSTNSKLENLNRRVHMKMNALVHEREALERQMSVYREQRELVQRQMKQFQHQEVLLRQHQQTIRTQQRRLCRERNQLLGMRKQQLLHQRRQQEYLDGIYNDPACNWGPI